MSGLGTMNDRWIDCDLHTRAASIVNTKYILFVFMAQYHKSQTCTKEHY